MVAMAETSLSCKKAANGEFQQTYTHCSMNLVVTVLLSLEGGVEEKRLPFGLPLSRV